MKTQQVKPLPDTPAVIVNVFIKEEHHYHKGAVHLDFHDHFMAHLVSKLKFYLHISQQSFKRSEIRRNIVPLGGWRMWS